jgi:hypothetical protein
VIAERDVYKSVSQPVVIIIPVVIMVLTASEAVAYYRRREIRPESAVGKPSMPAARSGPAIFFSVFTLLASS